MLMPIFTPHPGEKSGGTTPKLHCVAATMSDGHMAESW